VAQEEESLPSMYKALDLIPSNHKIIIIIIKVVVVIIINQHDLLICNWIKNKKYWVWWEEELCPRNPLITSEPRLKIQNISLGKFYSFLDGTSLSFLPPGLQIIYLVKKDSFIY
jgi:hypothetical protein